MMQVKKRDGRMEPFIVEKIVVSAVKSGAKIEDARMIAKEIEGKASEGMQTQEIRTKVLGMLRQKNAALEENWLMYDKAVKKRA